MGSRSDSPRPAADDTAAPKMTYLVGRLHRALRKRIGDALRPFELSVAQYTTLSVLMTRGQLSNAALANRAFISPQAMNEVVQTLEARRLVTRRADSSHGRIVHLLLTARGLDVVRKCDAAVAGLEHAMLEALPATQRNALRAALVKCTQALESG